MNEADPGTAAQPRGANVYGGSNEVAVLLQVRVERNAYSMLKFRWRLGFKFD